MTQGFQINSLNYQTWDKISFNQFPSWLHIKAIVYSFGELEWISINLSKSAVFSLQTLENNLTSP